MACQYRIDRECCDDHECPFFKGGGPCDGVTYEPVARKLDVQSLDDGAPRYTLAPALETSRD